jgi:hypothetical protein
VQARFCVNHAWPCANWESLAAVIFLRRTSRTGLQSVRKISRLPEAHPAPRDAPEARSSLQTEVRMRRLHYVLVLLATFALSVSFAVPAEDLPETAYDESESLPYEMTPQLSGDLVEESAPTLQVVLIAPSDFSTPRQALVRAGCRNLAAHPISDSLVILDHTLRC